MKTYVFVYDKCAVFEWVVLGYLMKSHGHEVITVSPETQVVTSYDGVPIAPDVTLKEVNAEDIDVFVIPGGVSYPMLGNPHLIQLLEQLDTKKTLIGAICHGPVLLAEAGLLAGRAFTSNVETQEPEFDLFKGKFVQQDVVVDGNIITATGNAYVEFAMELCRTAGVFPSEADASGDYRFFKNIKEIEDLQVNG